MTFPAYVPFGSGQNSTLSLPVIAKRDPVSTVPGSVQGDTISPNGSPFVVGDTWFNQVSGNGFQYIGNGAWTTNSSLTGDVVALTDTIGVVITPQAGFIKIQGTANQITSAQASAHVLGLSIPSVFIAPGSIAATTILTAGMGITSSTGNITATAGNVSAGAQVTAGTQIVATGDITSTGGNITAAVGDITATAGDIVATAGDISASTGNVTAGGSMASTTTVQATLGGFISVNGDLDLQTAGNKLKISTGANASVGTSAALAGTPGTITISTTAVKTASIIFLTRNAPGGTLGNLSIGTIVDGVSFVINSDANETSTVNWLIIN